MLLHERVVVVAQHGLGQGQGALTGVGFVFVRLLAVNLQQQAFLQVTRTHAGRVQQVNDVQRSLQRSAGHVDALGEGQIVHDAVQVPPQVPVVVQVTDEVLGQRP